ncbi:hypothetical protein [Actinomadura xylanilytica]|uniref:hypothetical protein n=1 Tax=Actinomadura xylanilytica TaxID=887459 RepID=UPI00255AC71B|nr:hypothetical protein [Actinomadura xylanilytica]MDL4774334.1 hypothetical protein [Actinomadura xylanilytica]
MRRTLEREAPGRLTLTMAGYPYLTYVTIAGMAGVIVAMAFLEDSRTSFVPALITLALGNGVVAIGSSAGTMLPERPWWAPARAGGS